MIVRRIQDIFRDNEDRLYHWAYDRAVPAESNLAERDLGPAVIAGKVSFGSVIDVGAQVRSILTTVTKPIRKRGMEAATQIRQALGLLAVNSEAAPYDMLFPCPSRP